MADHSRRRGRRGGRPEAIGDLLGNTRSQPVIRAAAMVLRLRRAWPEIAGEVLARRSEPAGLYRERLVVHVESSAWLNELQFVKAVLLERLQALAPAAGVTEIVLRIGPISEDLDSSTLESPRATTDKPEVDR